MIRQAGVRKSYRMLLKMIPLSCDPVPTMSINSFQFNGRCSTFQSDEAFSGSAISLHVYLKRNFVRKLQVTNENIESIASVITPISSFDKMEFKGLEKKEITSTYDAFMSRSNNESRYNC